MFGAVRSHYLRAIGCSFVIAAGLLSSGYGIAEELSAEQQTAALNFVLNNTHHVLLHEVGHMLVHQLDLPVLGKEEDAVDMLATITMLNMPEMGQALIDTMDGWSYSSKTRETRSYANSDLYDEHSLDIQRSFTIACLMVGKDMEQFGRIATLNNVPRDRQERCEEDYRVAQHGWDKVLSPYTKTGPSAAIKIVYAKSSAPYAQKFRQSRLLEKVAGWLGANFTLPGQVNLSMDECNEANAFYVPDDKEVIICYEWANFYHDLFVEHIMPKREHFELMRVLKREKLGL